MTQSRKDTYDELVSLGYTSEEAWEQIEQMEFSEDEEEYQEEDIYNYQEDEPLTIPFRCLPEDIQNFILKRRFYED